MAVVINPEFIVAEVGNRTMYVDTLIPTPTADSDIANKAYVDAANGGDYTTMKGLLNFAMTGSALTATNVMYQISSMGDITTLQLAPIPRTTLATLTTTAIVGGSIPATFRPTPTVTRSCCIYVGSSVVMGELSVASTGIVRITCPAGTTFTAGSPAGFPGLAITYINAHPL